ncbi:MAG TPA: hypothetical protein VGQ28_00055, partial [Thermoanaerobaculia bacterium]|nr:hypothetical protein [Thermoanaerobaculia bacterium]
MNLPLYPAELQKVERLRSKSLPQTACEEHAVGTPELPCIHQSIKKALLADDGKLRVAVCFDEPKALLQDRNRLAGPPCAANVDALADQGPACEVVVTGLLIEVMN